MKDRAPLVLVVDYDVIVFVCLFSAYKSSLLLTRHRLYSDRRNDGLHVDVFVARYRSSIDLMRSSNR